MENFGPPDKNHSRVEWPTEMFQDSVPLPTSFISLLSSNAAPSSSDLEFVKEFKAPVLDKISECQRGEDEIRRQIQELERELEVLQISRKPLEKQVYACDVITSSFRRLPDDVLHEIIRHCPIYSKNQCYAHFPSVLARVCRRWRKLVHGTSSLWTYLKLVWPRKSDPMAHFNHFARLSRSLPLKITLTELRPFELKTALMELEGNDILFFFRGLMSDLTALRRLEVLEVLASPKCEMLKILKDKDLPLLKSCVLLPPGHGGGVADPEEDRDAFILMVVHELLENAPQLTQLCFGGHELSPEPLLKLPQEQLARWSRLTTLNISGCVYVDEWYNLLKLCNNLQKAFIPLMAPADFLFPIPDLSLLHPHEHLEELILQHRSYHQHILLPFAGFSFPKLKALQIGFSDKYSTSEDQVNLQHSDFINVFPSLETLVLDNTVVLQGGIDAFVPLMRSVPMTKSLLISFSGKHFIEFLKFMREPLEDNCLPLHNLRCLELEFIPSLDKPWTNEIEYELTKALLATRRIRTPVHPLPNDTEDATSLPVLDEMIVRFNPISRHQKDFDVLEKKADMIQFFIRLRSEIDMIDDVDITVIPLTRDYRLLASPLMNQFMSPFEYWKSSMP
ncbi:hypothetical protein BJ165DRAFT_249174 [Panaeolus papilionaceus]|nr:hypothetical protein BJ165DRAFT_249174 [Panaeolus papilionaceus]